MIKLKELRKENGKTQEEIAKKISVSRQVYANYENEINEPPLNSLINLAKLFNVSTDYLLGLEDDFGAKIDYGNELTNDEKFIIQEYRKLLPAYKDLIKQQLAVFNEEERYSKNLK